MRVRHGGAHGHGAQWDTSGAHGHGAQWDTATARGTGWARGDGEGQRSAGDGARDAKPRTAPCGAAARWGHRALPQRDTSVGYVTGHERCARLRDAQRDTARGARRDASEGGATGEGGGGVRARWFIATCEQKTRRGRYRTGLFVFWGRD